MRKYSAILAALGAAVLVVLVTAREISLPFLSEKRERAVAELTRKIAAQKGSDRLDLAAETPSANPVAVPDMPGRPDAMAEWEGVTRRTQRLLQDKWAEIQILQDFLEESMVTEIDHSLSELENLKAFLLENRDLLEDVYSLCLTSRVHFVVPDLSQHGQPFNDSTPMTFKVQNCLTLLGSRAYLRALTDDPGGAYDDIRASIPQWRRLPAVLGKSATKAAIFEAVRVLLNGEHPDIEKAETLVSTYDEIRPGETGVQALSYTVDDVMSALKNYRKLYEARFPMNVEWWGYTTICRPLYEYDMEKFASRMSALLDVAQLPYYEALPTLDRVAEELAQRSVPRPSYSLTPDCLRPLKENAVEQTVGHILHLATAIEKYRRDHGGYPKELAQVATLLGGVVAQQPFSGLPYDYRCVDDAFTLSARVPDTSSEDLHEAVDLVWR